MRKVLLALGVLCAATAFATPARSTTFFEEKFECPIGGQKFKAKVVASNITFGQRPDGRPYSPLPVYPIVECPDNGFLLFDDQFSEDELAVLAEAIASPEFQSMRVSETPHYRAGWLKRKAGRDAVSQISSLLQATWETDDDQGRKERYQSEYINTVMQLARVKENANSWFWYNLRAINAMRELGYFAEALDRLDYVMRPEHLPDDPKAAENGMFLAKELRALLEEENHYAEPANLVPPQIAIFRCVVPRSRLTSAETGACQRENVLSAIADFEFKPRGGKKLIGEAAIRAADAERDTRASSH